MPPTALFTIIFKCMPEGGPSTTTCRQLGLTKITYRRTKVETMGCIARVIKSSLVIDAGKFFTMTGQHFGELLQGLKSITAYHIFRGNPGKMFVR